MKSLMRAWQTVSQQVVDEASCFHDGAVESEDERELMHRGDNRTSEWSPNAE
jgi:hypothetical protein